MNEQISSFSGSVPQNYDDLLGPFLFEPFALDLSGRAGLRAAADVLELACGTGRLTRHLAMHLPANVQLTATDLSEDMITIAREKIKARPINWARADMLCIPYKDDQFDLVICQFGIMLVPDQFKALQEIFRVLKKGGKLIFNVWGNIADNAVWQISAQVLKAALGTDPILQSPGPFSMQEERGIRNLMEKTGFQGLNIDIVQKDGEIENAAMAAKGFLEGLPLKMLLKNQDAGFVQNVQDRLTKELISQLGDQPMRSPLSALVCEAIK